MHRKHITSYVPCMGLKRWRKGSVKYGLPNFVLVIFPTKSGLFITTLIRKDRGWCRMNQPRRHQKLRFTKKDYLFGDCQFGRIIREFCTLNFYQETKRLIQTCTFNNSPNWARQFKKSGRNWQIVRVLFFSMIMQNPIHLWSLVKNYWK